MSYVSPAQQWTCGKWHPVHTFSFLDHKQYGVHSRHGSGCEGEANNATDVVATTSIGGAWHWQLALWWGKLLISLNGGECRWQLTLWLGKLQISLILHSLPDGCETITQCLYIIYNYLWDKIQITMFAHYVITKIQMTMFAHSLICVIWLLKIV